MGPFFFKERIMRGGLIFGSVLLVFSMHGMAADLPPVPKGYPNELALKAAYTVGWLKLIDAKNVAVPDSVEERLDVEYGKAGARALHLDLYLPKNRSGATPAILFLHGGAWKGGKRGDMKYYCVKFAEKGYVTATASYRLTEEAPFPAALHDVKCAVRWLRAQAEPLRIDPVRIAVSGNSAGGHLSMLIGYVDDPALEGDGGNNDVSSQVSCLVNFYGPTDLTTDFAISQDVVVNFMGGKPYTEAPAVYQSASPLFHLTQDDPPTLTFHGTIDSIVPVEQADRLDEKMKELGIPHLYEKYKGWPHTMDLAEPVNQRCVAVMEQFFQQYLSIPNPAE